MSNCFSVLIFGINSPQVNLSSFPNPNREGLLFLGYWWGEA